MNKRRLVNTLQNLTLLALTVSALYLLTRPPLLGDSWLPRMQSIFVSDEAEASPNSPTDPSAVLGSVHLVVTRDIGYGRHSRLYLEPDDAALAEALPLYREALGSAGNGESMTRADFQTALAAPGLYLDLRAALPMDILCAWLGESQLRLSAPVRAIALVAQDEANALLCLLAEDGSVTGCTTALPAAAVTAATDLFPPNGGSFAFESGYASLAPFTVLVEQLSPVSGIRLLLPDGCSAYSLLTALDFNPHTNYRYNESGGTEVVYDSSRSLRISPGGIISYTGDSQVTSSLYHVTHAGEAPTAAEVLSAASAIAVSLTQQTGAAPLSLLSAERTGQGWLISFGYQADGLPILLSGEEAALTVTVTGSTVTALHYQCRTFAYTQNTHRLLPPAMAAAIAALHPGGDLKLAYALGDGDEMTVQWLRS